MSLLREGDWHFPETEPMRHQDVVPAANFSQDGRRIVTASSDKTARLWDVAVDLDLRLPSWVPELGEALGGHKFNEEDGWRRRRASSSYATRGLRSKGNDFWSRFGRWFFMRGPKRTISPGSKMTVGELDRLRPKAREEEGTERPKPEPADTERED